MVADRMFLLQFGTERIQKSMSVRGATDETLREPIFGAVVETDIGWVLLDTGISRAALADPPALTAIYGAARHPIPLPGSDTTEPVELALATVGLAVGDLALAAVSHLHLDHSGGVPSLTRTGVPVVIQESELADGLARADAGTELEAAFYRTDYTDPTTRWQTVDGDTEIAAGVSVLSTPGHTRGHQSFRVELAASGTWILTADAADLAENLHTTTPCGWVADAADYDRAESSIRRLVDLGANTSAHVLPGHDPVVWAAAWHPRDGHC